MISPPARASYWQFLRVKYGYSDDQIRTYTFNMAPFLADKSAIQQGYLTSEPYKLQKAGANIVVMLLADGGYSSYSEHDRDLLEAREREARPRPAVRERHHRGLVQLPLR